MIVINTVDGLKFSFNGVNYLKNFTPIVVGDKIRILNTYDSKIELTDYPTLFSDFTVDGNTFANVALLQDALLLVIFTRSSLSDGGGVIPEAPIDGNTYGRLNGAWSFLNLFTTTIQSVYDTAVSNLNTLLSNTSGVNTGDQDLSPYELLSNKKTDLEANKTSNIFYASCKAIVDWIVARYQVILVSGTNIKTVNGNTLLGSGDLVIKRTQTVDFVISQNIVASNNWYVFRTYNSRITTATLTATLATLTPANDFSNMGILTPCRQVNFNCRIKNARFRGASNATATDIRIVIIKSFGLSGTLIANSDIIADKTFNTNDPDLNLCSQDFTGADLDPLVTIDGGSEIRFFLFNNNVASNLFGGILTVEFEEII